MEILGPEFINPFTKRVIQPEWVVDLLIGVFGFFDQLFQETVFHSKLNFFEKVVFIQRKEFSYHGRKGSKKTLNSAATQLNAFTTEDTEGMQHRGARREQKKLCASLCLYSVFSVVKLY